MSPWTRGAATVKAADRATPPALAVSVTAVDVVTERVAMAKAALVVPAATAMPAGSVAAVRVRRARRVHCMSMRP